MALSISIASSFPSATTDVPVTRLVIGGELDVSAVTDVRRHLHLALAERRPELDLDLSEVTFIDCAGLAVLLWCQEEARYAGSPLVTAALSRPVERLVRATRTSDRFVLVDSPQPAA